MTTILPSRFRLSTDRLSTALAVSGVTPVRGSGLPAPAPTTNPGTTLGDVVGDDTPAVALALRAAAAPARILRIAVHRPGAAVARATRMVRAPAPDEAVVSWASTDGEYSFVVVPNINLAVILLDEMLSITDLVAGPGTVRLELDAVGFAALLAASDAVREHWLRERLDRVVDPTPPVLTAARLEECWQRGLRNDDTRWAVAAARFASPVKPSTLTGHLGDGLASLRTLGVVAPSAGGDVPTDPGTFLLTVLGQIVATASIVPLAVTEGERVPLTAITLIRTATTIWAAGWTGPWSEPTVTLVDLTVEGALEMLRRLVEDLATPVSMPTPRAPTSAAPPPSVVRVRVPLKGLPAWESPVRDRPPATHLDAGLVLTLLETSGPMAHVEADNGWNGWVGNDLLERL